MNRDPGAFALSLLSHLTDWKSATELARETGYPIDLVKRGLKELSKCGLVFRDGPLYIARLGRR